MKQFIKYITPDFFKKIYRSLSTRKHPVYGWFGDYTSWKEAQKKCTGYDTGLILNKVKEATLKVIRGEAAFERDSVTFDQLEYVPEFVNILNEIAEENKGQLRVLDFGGSLGSVYFQHRSLLNKAKNTEWNVVEQKHFVDCGKSEFADEHLRFYYSCEECLRSAKIEILLLSSVLPYLEKPYDMLKEMTGYSIPYILIDRTIFIDDDRDRLTLQIVPKEIYEASYPCWLLNKKNVIEAIKGYELIQTFKPYADATLIIGTKHAYFEALLFKKKHNGN